MHTVEFCIKIHTAHLIWHIDGSHENQTENKNERKDFNNSIFEIVFEKNVHIWVNNPLNICIASTLSIKLEVIALLWAQGWPHLRKGIKWTKRNCWQWDIDSEAPHARIINKIQYENRRDAVKFFVFGNILKYFLKLQQIYLYRFRVRRLSGSFFEPSFSCCCFWMFFSVGFLFWPRKSVYYKRITCVFVVVSFVILSNLILLRSLPVHEYIQFGMLLLSTTTTNYRVTTSKTIFFAIV